jgi:hypothetical protein
LPEWVSAAGLPLTTQFDKYILILSIYDERLKASRHFFDISL